MDGWQPIATEPQNDVPRLVSDDPRDPDCAYLVTLRDDGKHFNGDVIIENFDHVPTHWHPVPVMTSQG